MIEVAGLFGPILKIVMIAVRVGALWMFFPVFSQSAIPARIRFCGVIALSLSLLHAVGPKLPNWNVVLLPTSAEILEFTTREFLVGAGMGLVARWIFAACLASASWVSAQMGFGMSGLFDPEFQSSENSWADFNQWVGVMVFFGIGGHLFFIQALADSYKVDVSQLFLKISDPMLSGGFWSEIGSSFFIWMLKLAAPMAVVLLLVQVSMGVLSRFVPQVNIWSVSIPATLGTGVIVFTLFSPMYSDALSSLFRFNVESNYLWLKFLGAR